MRMHEPDYFAGKPVEDLQHMLRVVARGDSRLPPLVADGYFGPQTQGAVRAFQRTRQLPVTGQGDLDTWELLVQEYELALIQQQPAEPLQLTWNPYEVLEPGQRHPYVYVVQALLHGLSQGHQSLPAVEFTGVLDGPTVAALRRFQRLSGLPEDGRLDKHTWRHLVRQYGTL